MPMRREPRTRLPPRGSSLVPTSKDPLKLTLELPVLCPLGDRGELMDRVFQAKPDVSIDAMKIRP
jgi:hypothetical protein